VERKVERRKSALLSDRKHRRKVGVCADGGGTTLQACLQSFIS
jgi:hypothetical protein